MPGKEYGTAKIESPATINKVIQDEDADFNRILSQNLRMSLNFRKLKLNGNILICGGSGAGKTFYEVKPNLMQMPHNCSFICTDPKGEMGLIKCGSVVVPFDNTISKDTGLYKLYNTNIHERIEMAKKEKQAEAEKH